MNRVSIKFRLVAGLGLLAAAVLAIGTAAAPSPDRAQVRLSAAVQAVA